MFSKATAAVVRHVDREGSLINASGVNDSHRLLPMALVVKRNRWFFWQKPKYLPTDFAFSDLLLGDEVLTPEVSERDYVNFKGTFGNQLSGGLEAEVSSANLALGGKSTSKLHTCFGQLKIEELNVRKLWEDSQQRLVDMEHELVQQIKKRGEVLTVLKERILTANSCSITQIQKDQCKLQGGLGMQGLLGTPFKVCLKDNNVEVDSDVSMEIPSGTVIAYSVLELDIKKSGRCIICLQSDITGGFEADTLSWSSDIDLNRIDSSVQELPEKAPLSALLNGYKELDLCPLAELPESTRRIFIEVLQETLKDRTSLTSLQFALEESCNGETLTSGNVELSEYQKKLFAAIWDQPGPDGHSGTGIQSQLKAAHLLVSAVEELPDEILDLLSISSHEDLNTLDMLMCKFKESGKPLSVETLPVPLQDDQRLKLAEQLLKSVNVTLVKDTSCLWTETGRHAGFLPLVLFLSIHGLAVLCSGLK